MKEIWRNIEGYNGEYQVSNLGRVKSLKYGKEKIRKPRANNNGYLLVNLSKNGKKKFFLVHRLVAETFLPNEDELPEVDHINGDKQDNRVVNLQWVTRIENNRRRQAGWGQPKRVQCIETGEIFESVVAAAKAVGRDRTTMSRHLSGMIQICAGKHWKYYEED